MSRLKITIKYDSIIEVTNQQTKMHIIIDTHQSNIFIMKLFQNFSVSLFIKNNRFVSGIKSRFRNN